MKRFCSISDSVNKRGSFHLLPDYGTILPSTGATFCHCRAQNEASWENFRAVYHRHSEYAFRLQDAWFCSWKTLLSILPFTLHLFSGNPDKHWGCERWRVGSTLHPPFTHPSPFREKQLQEISGCETPHHWWTNKGSAYHEAYTSFMHRAGHNRWPNCCLGEGWWRVVKGQWYPSPV